MLFGTRIALGEEGFVHMGIGVAGTVLGAPRAVPAQATGRGRSECNRPTELRRRFRARPGVEVSECVEAVLPRRPSR
jgi:hypothetical protein